MDQLDLIKKQKMNLIKEAKQLRYRFDRNSFTNSDLQDYVSYLKRDRDLTDKLINLLEGATIK